MMQEYPKISIVIPNRNMGTRLYRVLDAMRINYNVRPDLIGIQNILTVIFAKSLQIESQCLNR